MASLNGHSAVHLWHDRAARTSAQVSEAILRMLAADTMQPLPPDLLMMLNDSSELPLASQLFIENGVIEGLVDRIVHRLATDAKLPDPAIESRSGTGISVPKHAAFHEEDVLRKFLYFSAPPNTAMYVLRKAMLLSPSDCCVLLSVALSSCFTRQPMHCFDSTLPSSPQHPSNFIRAPGLFPITRGFAIMIWLRHCGEVIGQESSEDVGCELFSLMDQNGAGYAVTIASDGRIIVHSKDRRRGKTSAAFSSEVGRDAWTVVSISVDAKTSSSVEVQLSIDAGNRELRSIKRTEIQFDKAELLIGKNFVGQIGDIVFLGGPLSRDDEKALTQPNYELVPGVAATKIATFVQLHALQQVSKRLATVPMFSWTASAATRDNSVACCCWKDGLMFVPCHAQLAEDIRTVHCNAFSAALDSLGGYRMLWCWIRNYVSAFSQGEFCDAGKLSSVIVVVLQLQSTTFTRSSHVPTRSPDPSIPIIRHVDALSAILRSLPGDVITGELLDALIVCTSLLSTVLELQHSQSHVVDVLIGSTELWAHCPTSSIHSLFDVLYVSLQAHQTNVVRPLRKNKRYSGFVCSFLSWAVLEVNQDGSAKQVMAESETTFSSDRQSWLPKFILCLQFLLFDEHLPPSDKEVQALLGAMLIAQDSQIVLHLLHIVHLSAQTLARKDTTRSSSKATPISSPASASPFQSKSPLVPVTTLFHGEVAHSNQQDRRAKGTPVQAVPDVQTYLSINPPIAISAARAFLTRFIECDGQSVLALLMGRSPAIRCAALKTFCAVLSCIHRAGFVAGASLVTMKEISTLVADRLHRCKCNVDEIVAAFEMLHCDVPVWFECSKSNPFASPVRPVVFYSAFNVLFSALRNADPGTRLIAHMRLAALASTEGSAEKLISGFPEWQQVFCEDLCVMSHNLSLPDAHEDDVNALDCALSFLSRVVGDVCFHSAAASGTSSVALLLHTLSECRSPRLLPMFLLKVFGEINSRLSGLNHSECIKLSNLWNIVTHLGMWSVLATSGTGNVKLDQESSTGRSAFEPVSPVTPSLDVHRPSLSRSIDVFNRTCTAPDILEAFLKATDTLLRFAATNITAWEMFTADVSAIGETVVSGSPSKFGGFFPVRGLVSSVVGAVGSVMELIAYAAGESQYPPISLWSLVLGSTMQCILYRAEKAVVAVAEQGLPPQSSSQRAPDSLASYNRVFREHFERVKTVLSVACQPKDMSWFGYAKAAALKSTPRLLFSAITIVAASLNLLPFGPLGSLKVEESSGSLAEPSEFDGFLILGFHDRLWPAVQDLLIKIGLVDQFAAFIHTHSSTLLSYPELSPLRPVIAASSKLTSDLSAHNLVSDFLAAMHSVAWVKLLHSSTVLSQAFRGVEKCQFGCSTSVSRWVMYQRNPSTKDATSVSMHNGGSSIQALESNVARVCNTLMLRLARHRQSRLSDSDLTFHSGMGMLSDWEDEFASEIVPLPMSIAYHMNINHERQHHEPHGTCTARYNQDSPLSHIKVDAHEHALSRMRMRMRYCKKPLVARPAESIDEDALACASDGDGRSFENGIKILSSSARDIYPPSIIDTRSDSSDRLSSNLLSRGSSWDIMNLDGDVDLSSSLHRTSEKGDDALEFDAATTEIDEETEIVGRSVVSGGISFNAQRVRAAVESGMRLLNLRFEVGNHQPRDRSSSDIDTVMVQSTPSVSHIAPNSDSIAKSFSLAQGSSSTEESVETSTAATATSSTLTSSTHQVAAARPSEDIVVTPPIHTNDLKLALDCEYVRPMQVVRGIFSIAQHSVCFYVPNVSTPGCDIDSVPDAAALWTIISNKSVKGYSHVRRVMQLHHPGVHPCTCHILFCVSTLKVKKILRRRFLLQPTAMELLRSNRYYMFSFRHSSVSGPLANPDLRSVKSGVARLEHAIEALIPLISSDSSRRDFRVYKNGAHAFAAGVASYTDLWTKRAISNFDYLMYLNTIAGRTYNDLTQYPVFPWVLQDFTSSEINLGDKKSFRDLSKPIGAQDPVRQAKVQDRYVEFEDSEGTPKFHYGSHYSSLGSVLFFLIRMRPFTDYALDLQGGHFDHADRIFTSIHRTYTNITTSMTDVKELLPEFYYNPHFLDNHNGLTLGQRQNGTLVSEVDLPPWANGSSQVFVDVMRAALESEYVSANLHHWIDLVFGHKQQGAAAVDATNVFFYLTYEGSVDLDAIDPAALVAIETQIANFGQTPAQLLTTPHRPRQVLSNTLSSMRIYSPRLPSALSGSVAPFVSPGSSASSQSLISPPGRRLLSFSADDTVKLLYRYDPPSSAMSQANSSTATSSISMSNITEVYKAARKLGDGGGEIVTIMPNERCSTIFALTTGGSLIELKVVGGDRQWSSPGSQICKNLDWPLHRVLAHGSTLGKSASAMVGDRLVSVGGWEGGATMRSVPVAGGRSNIKTVFHHSIGCCCVSASPDGNWIVTGGFDGTVSIYKSTNRFEDSDWTPYFWNRSHAAMITHCSVWPSHSIAMTGCDNGVLVLRDLSRQLLLLSFDFGPNFSIISAHIVGHSIVVLSGPCLDAGFSSIGITKCAKSEQPRVCKLSMISFGGVLQHEVVVDPSACALAFCPDPSYLEPPGLLFLAQGSVIDVYSAFNLGRLSTLRLSSEDQSFQITALNSVQQKLLAGDSSGSIFVLDVST